jgi:hypothetical protein
LNGLVAPIKYIFDPGGRFCKPYCALKSSVHLRKEILSYRKYDFFPSLPNRSFLASISVFIKPAEIPASIGRIELNRMPVILSCRKGQVMVTRLACAHIASALPPTGVRLPLIWIDQRCPKVDQARTAIFKEWYTSTAPEHQSAHSRI